MIEVTVKDGSDEAFAKAMSTFKKICTKDGILKEATERRYFRKPSDVKREYTRKRKAEQKRNNKLNEN